MSFDRNGNVINTGAHGVSVPAGTYIVGDPCYVLHQWWDAFLDNIDSIRNTSTFKIDNDVEITCVFFDTAYGDGAWRGSDGQVYAADAGMLGLVPAIVLEYGEEAPGWYNKLVTFDQDFTAYHDGVGRMDFGGIKVNTNDDDYEEEEPDWDEEYEEYDDLDEDVPFLVS